MVELDSVCLVMEFMESDLNQLLKQKIEFDREHLIKLVYNCLCAFEFMHETNVLHRAIKSANLLID